MKDPVEPGGFGVWTRTSGCDSGTPLRRGALPFGRYLPSLAREEAFTQALRIKLGWFVNRAGCLF